MPMLYHYVTNSREWWWYVEPSMLNTCTVAVVGKVLETIANCLKQKLHLKVCLIQLVNIFHPVYFVPNMSSHLGS